MVNWMLDCSEPLSQEVRSRAPASSNAYLFGGKKSTSKSGLGHLKCDFRFGLDFRREEIAKGHALETQNQLYFLEDRAGTTTVRHLVAA